MARRTQLGWAVLAGMMLAACSGATAVAVGTTAGARPDSDPRKSVVAEKPVDSDKPTENTETSDP